MTVPEIGTFTAAPTAGRRAHLEPQPRAARRAAPPLPLPLDRLPEPGARRRDPAPGRAGRQRGADRLRDPVRRAGARRWTWTSRRAWPRRSTGSRALSALGAAELVRDDVVRTLGAIAKTPDDRDTVLGAVWTPCWMTAPVTLLLRRRPGRVRRRASATGCATRERRPDHRPGRPVRGAGRGTADAARRALLDGARDAGPPAGRPRRLRRGVRRGVPGADLGGDPHARRRASASTAATAAEQLVSVPGHRGAGDAEEGGSAVGHAAAHHARARRAPTRPSGSSCPSCCPSALDGHGGHPVRRARRGAAGPARPVAGDGRARGWPVRRSRRPGPARVARDRAAPDDRRAPAVPGWEPLLDLRWHGGWSRPRSLML